MLNSVNEKPQRGRVMEEGAKSPDVETDDDGAIIITVKIPKPEALIFSGRVETKYSSIPLEKSFAAEIMGDVKKPVF